MGFQEEFRLSRVLQNKEIYSTESSHNPSLVTRFSFCRSDSFTLQNSDRITLSLAGTYRKHLPGIFANNSVSATSTSSVARRDRLVVRTLRCGRSNPGSNPGPGIILLCFLLFYF